MEHGKTPRSMDIPRNALKAALHSKQRQIGFWSNLASNLSVEILAGAGFDWILLDTEHSPNELSGVLSQLQAAAAYPSSAVVRVPWNDMVMIKRFLDLGAQSLLVPYVSNAEEARLAASYVRYPPRGLRGVAASTRAGRWGRVRDYAKRAHEETCLIVQAETREALENLEAICAVEGIDGVFIGPSDLHASLGFPGETANPQVRALIDRAIGRIRAAGKAPGILTSVEADARHWLECGALMVAVGSDSAVLARGTEALAQKFRQ